MTTLLKQKFKAAARFGLILGCLALASRPASAQVSLTNVSVVNVTPSGFSVTASVSPAISPATVVKVLIFADSAGKTSLAGQVGVEYYPLNTGDPTAANSYSALLSKAALRQDSMKLGLIYARVTYCAPSTTYYYQISVTETNGQSAVWPASGPLPSATTALENSFVLQSQQLIVTLDAANPTGSILLLSTSNSSSILAAVVGDGAGTNQAFFNVNDLIAASGGTNYAPIGTQAFTASVLGAGAAALAQSYDLIFSDTFSAGQAGVVSLGQLATSISIGEGVMRAGSSGSVPISVDSQGALVSLSFLLNVPSNEFSAITVQPSIPAVGAATLTIVSSNVLRLSFTAASGLNLEGNQQIAQLNLTSIPNAPSAFAILSPQTPQAITTTPAIPNVFFVQPGRVAIIGGQPLLDTQLIGSSRNLVLHGIPGLSYQIQSLTNLAQAGGWSDLFIVPMTNTTEVFSNLDRTAAAVFFRAYVLNADPPVLQATRSSGKLSLVAFGLTGTNYSIQTSSDISDTVGWRPLLSYTLTNSFQYFTNLGPNSTVFYRLKKQ